MSAATLLAAAIVGIGMMQQPAAAQDFDPEMLHDPIALIQQRIDSGEVTLSHVPGRGYLDSLLEALGIPASSQTLVFSKTSFQSPRISHETPRALYFNDDVYIGWVQGGPVVEIAAVHPKYGTLFYTLSQEQTSKPTFERETVRCIACHLPARSRIPIPRLTVMSILPSRSGSAVGPYVLETTDQSPFRERWGGWYVTGTHGKQMHRGNMVVGSPKAGGASPRLDRSRRANVVDLGDHLDTSPYLNGHSDIVALSLLAHQSDVHNLIGEASFAVGEAVRAEASRRPAGESGYSRRTMAVVKDTVEPLVRKLLFAEAVPLTDPIEGTSGFAAEFVRQGPFDRHGRSLRDLDLNTRMLRYPLSYLIYSKSFDGMPDLARKHAYSRLLEILSGRDNSPEFAHLSAGDRKAVLEILEDTKPDFKAWIEARRFEPVITP